MIETLFPSPREIRLSGSTRGAGSPGHVTISWLRTSETSWIFIAAQNSRDDHCIGGCRARVPGLGRAARGTLHPRLWPPLSFVLGEVPGPSASRGDRTALRGDRVLGASDRRR